MYENELYHHGILGQKWGVRRFQNYDGTRIKRFNTADSNKKDLSEQQKKAIKTAATITAGLLISYGGYKLATSPTVRAKANNILHGNKDKRLADISKEIESMGPEIVRKNEFGGSENVIKSIGKSISDIDRKLVSGINEDGWDTGNPPRLTCDYSRNCSHTSIAYIMNSVLDMNVKAKGFGGVDEFSGLVQKGRNKNVFDSVFEGIKTTEVPHADYDLHKAIRHIKNGTTGIVFVHNGEDGHFLNYERDKSGRLTFVDCQNGKLWDIKDSQFYPNIKLTDIFDCSDVRLREDASKTLSKMVEYR